MGAVRLLNIALFGHHGVTQAERDAGTRLDLDVELTFDSSVAESNDDLAETIDYQEQQLLDFPEAASCSR